jgi:hypothetical protein
MACLAVLSLHVLGTFTPEDGWGKEYNNYSATCVFSLCEIVQLPWNKNYILYFHDHIILLQDQLDQNDWKLYSSNPLPLSLSPFLLSKHLNLLLVPKLCTQSLIYEWMHEFPKFKCICFLSWTALRNNASFVHNHVCQSCIKVSKLVYSQNPTIMHTH